MSMFSSPGTDSMHMKILIAYDGSKSSDAALDDLVRAGLPAAGSAVVISVSEVWLPPNETEEREKGNAELAEAEAMAGHAKKRVQNLLPGWGVDTVVDYGSPAAEILSTADAYSP